MQLLLMGMVALDGNAKLVHIRKTNLKLLCVRSVAQLGTTPTQTKRTLCVFRAHLLFLGLDGNAKLVPSRRINLKI
jgi:hypothetical protein